METSERSKMGKRNRRKGGDYERKISKKLAKLTSFRWSRVPYSGASYIPGDVISLDFAFPFVFELKNREDIDMGKVFRAPYTLRDLVSYEQILIFNNYGQDLVLLPSKMVSNPELPYAKLQLVDIECTLITLENFAKILMEIKNEK